jgi:hypothetical protein
VDVEMKKWIIALSICTLLTCSAQTITAASIEPIVRLPNDYVTMTAEHADYPGSQIWFNFTLIGVPSGYDISNGVYTGWCVDKYHTMDLNVDHQVKLKSCYASDLVGFGNINWEQMNYIINHKQGKTRTSIQRAIWYFTNDIIPEGYPGAWAIINDTINNSAGYIPQNNEILAIAIEAQGELQLAFLELVIPVTNDYSLVWKDTNKDGLQGVNEPGLSGVTVQLYYSNDTLFQTTTTNPLGHYTFTDVLAGDYYLKFTVKSGYKFTIKDTGSDDTLDSDADDTTNGKT